MLRPPVEPKLDAAVGVVDEIAGDGLAIVQGLLQRVEHEAGVRRPRHALADDAAGVASMTNAT
jgi:hypothetical protein